MNQERIKKLTEYEMDRETRLFEKAKEALQLIDLTKSESRTFQTFNKETLRTYLRNPFSNQNSIRELSRYLYRILGTYKRIIDYYVQMIDVRAYSVVPLVDYSQEVDHDAVMQQYMRTLQKLENMNLRSEFRKMILEAWLVGVAYGIVWEGDGPDEFLITLLDPTYCKISSANFDGTYNFAFDFSWFRSHATQLEYYGEPFNKMYTAYQNDPNNMRWQEIPSEISCCLLMDRRDPTCIIPPFTPLFEDLCDLSDLRSIQAQKDELSIYKLLVAQMETIDNSDLPDNFKVDPETAIQYVDKMTNSLDERIGMMLSPLPIKLIDFEESDTKETDRISNSIKNVLLNSGGAQILLGSSITGTTAYHNAMIADTEFGLHPLLEEIESWVNHHLRQTVNDPAKVVFMHVSAYNRDEVRDYLLKTAQYGIPNKIAIATLNGFSPLEVMSNHVLENEILDLANTWVPLSNSFTTSGGTVGTDPIEGGRPTSETPISDEGEKSKEKR